MSTQDDHETLVRDCENRESKLTDWERGFIDGARNAIDAGRTLSAKQSEILNEIWDRIT